jgi:uncharacterized protein (DUF488 family)
MSEERVHAAPGTLWTVGHSNRQLGEFLDLLTGEGIEAVADVRRFPGSRRCPHFGGEALEAALRGIGVAYRHYPHLGGRRGKRLDPSPNTAWRVEAFGAYADYTLSREFGDALDRLLDFAHEKRTAIMCAEALPWRCHRRLIADQFVARNWRVVDILGPGQARRHELPAFAQVENGRVTYPGETLF